MLRNVRITETQIVIGALGIVHKDLGRVDGRVGNPKMNRHHPNYSMNEIGQNTEKSPGGLRRLAVTQTLVKSHQLMLI